MILHTRVDGIGCYESSRGRGVEQINTGYLFGDFAMIGLAMVYFLIPLRARWGVYCWEFAQRVYRDEFWGDVDGDG